MFFLSSLAIDAEVHAGISLPSRVTDRLVALGTEMRRIVDGFALEASTAVLFGERIRKHFRLARRRPFKPIAHAVRTGSDAASTNTRPVGSSVAWQRSV